MKKILCAFCFILTSSFQLYTQTSNALLKYEEATIAYEKNDFEKCIIHLNEAEKLSGKTTVNVLYLRILTNHQLIIKQGGFVKVNFNQIENLNQLCNKYISLFGKITDMQSRFTKVNTIWNTLPKSKLIHDNQIAEFEHKENLERNNLLKQKVTLNKNLKSVKRKIWRKPTIGLVTIGLGFGTRAWANKQFLDDDSKKFTAKTIGGTLIAVGSLSTFFGIIYSRNYKYRLNLYNKEINEIDTKLGKLSFDYTPIYNNSVGVYSHNIGIKLDLKY